MFLAGHGKGYRQAGYRLLPSLPIPGQGDGLGGLPISLKGMDGAYVRIVGGHIGGGIVDGHGTGIAFYPIPGNVADGIAAGEQGIGLVPMEATGIGAGYLHHGPQDAWKLVNGGGLGGYCRVFAKDREGDGKPDVPQGPGLAGRFPDQNDGFGSLYFRLKGMDGAHLCIVGGHIGGAVYGYGAGITYGSVAGNGADGIAAGKQAVGFVPMKGL